MTNDGQLLHQYIRERSESSFGELVRRHVDLVYSAALRVAGGDCHLAQDVTQMVFMDLARKAWRLPREVLLAGWLHRHTCYVAAKAVRTERRRKTREQAAMELKALDDNTELPWERIAPHLDDGLNQLSASDRDVLALRYLKRQDLRAVGAAFGISEDAAQKRVSRALDKLRGVLRRHGIELTATALASLLAAEALTAAPAGLAVGVTATSLAAAAGTGTTLTILQVMATTKLQTGIISAVLVASAVISLTIQQRSRASSREVDEAQRHQADQLIESQVEKERLSDLIARSSRLSASDENELLRLRDELSALRKRTNNLAALRETRRQLETSLNQARQRTKGEVSQPPGLREEAQARVEYCKYLGLALFEYATDHHYQFPTSFDEVAAFFSARVRAETNFTTGQFEIVYRGTQTALEKYAHPGAILLIREKRPWRAAGGQWAKVYVMCDMSATALSAADGNFERWEKEHIVTSESSKP